jgi:monoamine oxidase
VGDPVLAAWASDPFARGAYSAVSNETLTLLGALEEPFGRAAFAGEHTAGVRWHGTMEGAIRSGRRAAAHVLRMLALD